MGLVQKGTLREWTRHMGGSLGMYISEPVAMSGFQNAADFTSALTLLWVAASHTDCSSPEFLFKKKKNPLNYSLLERV